MTKPIVSVKDYSLTIGKKQIVKNLSFDVLPGEVFAFLGANGSGKTSTIRSLLGIYDTTSGELLVNGKKLVPENAGIVGYLPEERGLYTRAKVLDAEDGTVEPCECRSVTRTRSRARGLASAIPARSRRGWAIESTTRRRTLRGWPPRGSGRARCRGGCRSRGQACPSAAGRGAGWPRSQRRRQIKRLATRSIRLAAGRVKYADRRGPRTRDRSRSNPGRTCGAAARPGRRACRRCAGRAAPVGGRAGGSPRRGTTERITSRAVAT